MKNFKDHTFILMQVGNFCYFSVPWEKVNVSPNLSMWVSGINFAVLVRDFFVQSLLIDVLLLQVCIADDFNRF